MEDPTLKRKFFIIEFLDMSPTIYKKGNNIRKSHFKIPLNTDLGEGVLILRVCHVNELTKGISDFFQRFQAIVMNGKIYKLGKNGDLFGNV